MLPEDSPFPCHWWGTSLEDVGLADVRPRVGNYGCYEFANLPPVPNEINGNFDWLAIEPPQNEHNIGEERAAENAKALAMLCAACKQMGVRLPSAFVKFMEAPSLHQRIRSNTDCFLDLCARPVQSPVGDGYLIRFLADSQGCIFWYLFVTGDSSDHAVVSSSDFYGTEDDQSEDEPPDPSELAFSAESFEAFIWRFWLENEMWFSGWKKTPMPSAGEQYIEQYRSKKS